MNLPGVCDLTMQGSARVARSAVSYPVTVIRNTRNTCALPVVISDQVNIHAEVSGAGAALVTACDAGAVTAALELLLRDAERRRAMGAAGRRLVQARFTWPAIVAQLTAEYQKVIDRHRHAGAGREAAAAAGDAK